MYNIHWSTLVVTFDGIHEIKPKMIYVCKMADTNWLRLQSEHGIIFATGGHCEHGKYKQLDDN